VKMTTVKNKSDRIMTRLIGILSFLCCFIGIMAEQDMLVFGTLALLVGMLAGLGIGNGIKRLTGWE